MKPIFRWVLLIAGIFAPLFALFWAVGGLAYGAKVTLGLMAVIAAALPVTMALLFAVLFIPIAIHEYGHYIAGRAVGFQFVAAFVGPLGLRQEKDRIVRFRQRPAIVGGYVVMMPSDDIDLQRRYTRFIAGGPIASLLLVALVFGLWWASGIPVSVNFSQTHWLARCVHFGFLSAAIGSLQVLPGTLIPTNLKSLGGLPSDTMHLLMMRRGGDAARSTLAQLALFGMLNAGVPAGDLPLSLLADAERGTGEDIRRLAALQMRWAYELERTPELSESTAQSIARLGEGLAKRLPKHWGDSVRLVQALQAAFVRQDADAAEGWIKGVGIDMPNFEVSARVTEAAIAAIRRTPDLIERVAAAEATVVAASVRTSQNFDFERRWLASMREGWPNVVKDTVAEVGQQ